MKITVTNPDTVFGTIVKVFDDCVDAMKWVKVCLDNGVQCIVETTGE
jgi:hypothetical protein